MYKKGKIVMYRREVCRIAERVTRYRNDEDYFALTPLQDETLKIHVPVSQAEELFITPLDKSEIEALIARIPDILPLDTQDRVLEADYRNLFNSGDHEDLIRIIKTAYLRSEEKNSRGLKRSEKDKMYFRKAEQSLYGEFAVALEKTYAQTREYVVDQVKILEQQAA